MANDSGVRAGILTTEFLTFAIGGVLLIMNGTTFINIPWDTLTGYLALGGVYMGGRAVQKTAATWTTGRTAQTPAQSSGERNNAPS